jgi:hypothetical protein
MHSVGGAFFTTFSLKKPSEGEANFGHLPFKDDAVKCIVVTTKMNENKSNPLGSSDMLPDITYLPGN